MNAYRKRVVVRAELLKVEWEQNPLYNGRPSYWEAVLILSFGCDQ